MKQSIMIIHLSIIALLCPAMIIPSSPQAPTPKTSKTLTVTVNHSPSDKPKNITDIIAPPHLSIAQKENLATAALAQFQPPTQATATSAKAPITPPLQNAPQAPDDDFVHVANQPINPRLAITAITAILQSLLGQPYPTATIPEQDAEDYSLWDFHVLRTNPAYLAALIESGSFGLAYARGPLRDPKFEGRLSNGIAEATNNIQTILKITSQRRNAGLMQDRGAIIAELHQLERILIAASRFDEKRTAANVIEESFGQLTVMRQDIINDTTQFIAEQLARFNYLGHLQNLLRGCHNNQTTLDVITTTTWQDYLNSVNAAKPS